LGLGIAGVGRGQLLGQLLSFLAVFAGLGGLAQEQESVAQLQVGPNHAVTGLLRSFGAVGPALQAGQGLLQQLLLQGLHLRPILQSSMSVENHVLEGLQGQAAAFAGGLGLLLGLGALLVGQRLRCLGMGLGLFRLLAAIVGEGAGVLGFPLGLPALEEKYHRQHRQDDREPGQRRQLGSACRRLTG
jgi:hypothetical protein